LKNLKTDFYAVFGEFKNAGNIFHFHETFSIGFFTKGGCKYKVGSKDEIIKAGDIRIIPPFELHKTYKGEWEYLHFDIGYESILNFLYPIEIKQNTITHKSFQDKKLFNIAFELYSNLNDELMFEENFIKLCERIYKSFCNVCIIDYKKSKLSKAIEYIFTYWNKNDLTVEEIANSCDLSLYHFTRNFHKLYGITPHRFIMSLRVERAKEKILKTSLPMSVIAYECGFSDQSHMIRTFKKFLGYKPGILRG